MKILDTKELGAACGVACLFLALASARDQGLIPAEQLAFGALAPLGLAVAMFLLAGLELALHAACLGTAAAAIFAGGASEALIPIAALPAVAVLAARERAWAAAPAAISSAAMVCLLAAGAPGTPAVAAGAWIWALALASACVQERRGETLWATATALATTGAIGAGGVLILREAGPALVAMGVAALVQGTALSLIGEREKSGGGALLIAGVSALSLGLFRLDRGTDVPALIGVVILALILSRFFGSRAIAYAAVPPWIAALTLHALRGPLLVDLGGLSLQVWCGVVLLLAGELWFLAEEIEEDRPGHGHVLAGALAAAAVAAELCALLGTGFGITLAGAAAVAVAWRRFTAPAVAGAVILAIKLFAFDWRTLESSWRVGVFAAAGAALTWLSLRGTDRARGEPAHPGGGR